MRIKVAGGTARGDENLCMNCTLLMRLKWRSGKELLKCAWQDAVLRQPVSECTEYRDKNQPSFSDLKDIAWIVSADPRGRVGFTAPKPKSEDDRIMPWEID